MHKRLPDIRPAALAADEDECRVSCACSCKAPVTDKDPEGVTVDQSVGIAASERPVSG